MIVEILLFILGVILILGGANALTEGASSVAYSFGISPLVVGLTIVAFGTSAPEFVVSLTSAIGGNPGIAIGNVVGSNVLNILLILGITALIHPLSITNSTVKWEIPLLMLVSFVMFVMVKDNWFSGSPLAEEGLSIGEGLVLLSFFIVFMYYTFAIAKRGAKGSGTLEQENEVTSNEVQHRYSTIVQILLIIGGLGALIYGGDLFVKSASSIAQKLGMSEALIGLTIVSFGTSVPELATSIVAARKGEPELAVGNVVGSGLFNILFILGATAAIHPIEIGGVTSVDLFVMLFSTIVLYLTAICFGTREVTRLEGLVLLSFYIIYTVYLFLQS